MLLQKWVVASEANLTSESGSVSRYLQLVPYENGQPVPNTFATAISNISRDDLSYVFMCPVNYPDWWRSSIPLVLIPMLASIMLLFCLTRSITLKLRFLLLLFFLVILFMLLLSRVILFLLLISPCLPFNWLFSVV